VKAAKDTVISALSSSARDSAERPAGQEIANRTLVRMP
jgi:hypothetical protein